MLVPKINKAIYLSDILAFLEHIYGDDFDDAYETRILMESMYGNPYREYTKEMFKDKNAEIPFDIREMRDEGILPKEFIVISDLG